MCDIKLKKAHKKQKMIDNWETPWSPSAVTKIFNEFKIRANEDYKTITVLTKIWYLQKHLDL